MARTAKYTAQSSLKIEPSTKKRIKELAAEFDLSDADVVRECIDVGFPLVEDRLRHPSDAA